MEPRHEDVAARCLRGAEDHTMSFPQIVGALIEAGFESYAIDFRRAKAIYYRPDGDSIALKTHRLDQHVADGFDRAAIQAAIRDAQQLAPGYSYASFCRRVMAAGCASYLVSFSGRRALYVGRTAETHVEPFPT